MQTAAPPALFVWGGAETPAFHAQSRDMAGLWQQQGNEAACLAIEGADHFFKDDEAHMKPMIDTVQTYVRRRLTEGSR